MAMPQSPKLIARNVAAVRRFADPANLTATVAGNPVSTRLESGIGNCFPGLECDLAIWSVDSFRSSNGVIEGFLVLASVDTVGVAHAKAAGDVSDADAASYPTLADRGGGWPNRACVTTHGHLRRPWAALADSRPAGAGRRASG